MKNTIKLVAVGLLLAGTAAMAGKTVKHSYNTTTNNYGDENYYSTTIVDADITNQRVSGAALASVELDPSRKGFSVGVGGSAYAGTYGGAVGVMYGTTVLGKDVGLNVKGTTAEGGYHQGSVGITVGF